MHYHNVLISLFSDAGARHGNTMDDGIGEKHAGDLRSAQIIAESKLCIEALVRLYFCGQHPSSPPQKAMPSSKKQAGMD